MANFTASVTAAVGVVGYDVLSGEVWSRSPRNRVLSGMAYTGSAAIGDTEGEIFIDEVRVGQLFNSKLLVGNIDDMQPLDDLGIPAGAQLRFVINDAAASNPVFVIASIRDL
ncbi:MAG TPA: hypothetical protein EYO33_13215 [Phycisphaerales bacterium]|nr:hypothetical protein [Phycisphaerales bacterium]